MNLTDGISHTERRAHTHRPSRNATREVNTTPRSILVCSYWWGVAPNQPWEWVSHAELTGCGLSTVPVHATAFYRHAFGVGLGEVVVITSVCSWHRPPLGRHKERYRFLRYYCRENFQRHTNTSQHTHIYASKIGIWVLVCWLLLFNF